MPGVGASMMMLGVTIQLFDKMSPGVGDITRKVGGLTGKLESMAQATGKLGQSMLSKGLVVSGALTPAVTAFAEMEDASTRLRSVMMRSDGTVGAFERINALAIRLGNELPGTTADFQRMMSVLKERGLSDESILGGVGDATARMAVLLKQAPAQMAEFSAKLKTSLGIADQDMLAFMDTIQRTAFLGVNATEMMYAFGRSGGALKTLGLQGLEAGKALAPLFAMWDKTGMTGETIGTGFASMTNALLNTKKIKELNEGLATWGIGPLKFVDDQGNFAGVANLVEQFDKLKGLNSVQLNKALSFVFGGGQDQGMAATLVKNGVEGYREMVKAMEAQASLGKRVNVILGTLTNLWEAAEGSFTNLRAAIGGLMGDDLKMLAKWFGELSEAVKGFVAEYPEFSKWCARVALGIAAINVVGGGLLIVFAKIVAALKLFVLAALSGVGAFATLLKVLSAVGAFMLANPIMIAIVLLIAAAGMIYENWEPISEFFRNLWAGIQEYIRKFDDWLLSKIEAWREMVRSLTDLMPDWMKGNSEVSEPARRQMLEMYGPEVPLSTPGKRDAQGDGKKPPFNRWLGPELPLVTPENRDTRVGGEVDIRVRDERLLVNAKTKNPNIPMYVDVGDYRMAWSN